MARGGRVVYKRAGGRARPKEEDEEDDGDQEYVAGEDESESSGESLVDSEEEEEKEEESFELTESSESSEDDVDEVVEVAKPKPRGRPRKTRTIVSDEEEKEEAELTSVPRRQARNASRRRRRSSASEDDEDFNPDEHDSEEEELFVAPDKKKNSFGRRAVQRGWAKKGRPKKRKTATKPVRKRRRRRVLSSDDDDFIVKDRIALDNTRKKSNGKVKKRPNNVRKKRSVVDSEEEDFDFVVLDDEESDLKKKTKRSIRKKPRSNGKRKRSFEESEPEFDSFVSDEEVSEITDRRRNVKKRPVPTGKKRRSMVDSESSDFDYEISEGELRDLRIEGVTDRPKTTFFMGRQREGKGKEKESEDLGKQVCGICLSDEQKGTIRGVLDSCVHFFCFACIMEWSKVESRCPMCKQRFTSISKSARSDSGFGLRRAVIRVPKRDQVYQPSEEEMRVFIDPYENVVCIVCQQGGDDNLMLLCDICDSSAHTYCVGLGREVPEGNWYCEACRSIDAESSYTQVPNAVSEQGPSSSRLFSVGIGTEDIAANVCAGINAQRSVSNRRPSFIQGFDLNLSPKNHSEEDPIASSPVSGSGAATLSGRRAIHQRIRIILSSSANRLRQRYFPTHGPHGNAESDVNTSQIDPKPEAINVASNGLNHTQTCRPVVRSNLSLSRCVFNEGSSLRHVDGAKEHIQTMVKDHLKNLSKDIPLDHDVYKDVARCSTHTILAACGIEHRRDKVVGPIQPPNACSHEADGKSIDLAKGCCSSCFGSFVSSTVLRVINTSL